jgi:hypothetical protein
MFLHKLILTKKGVGRKTKRRKCRLLWLNRSEKHITEGHKKQKQPLSDCKQRNIAVLFRRREL